MQNVILILGLIFSPLLSISASAQMLSQLEYKQIFESVLRAFTPELTGTEQEPKGAQVNYEMDWTSEDVNLYAGSDKICLNCERTVDFQFHGGYFRYFKPNAIQFSIALCHEFAHIFVSHDEGIADYWSMNQCIVRALSESMKTEAHPTIQGEIKQLCSSSLATDIRRDYCETLIYNSFLLMKKMRNLMQSYLPDWNEMLKHPETIQEGVDLKAEVKSVEADAEPVLGIESEPVRAIVGHPSSQCRLELLVAGILAKPMPKCWTNRPQP